MIDTIKIIYEVALNIFINKFENNNKWLNELTTGEENI
jgi:ABC-type uncharacterized transport system fused permease/ATPase subunit